MKTIKSKIQLSAVVIGILLFMLAIGFSTYASHIVGGEIIYKYLGNDSFRVFVSIYEDCLNGSPDAISADNPAFLNIYTGGLSSGNNVPFYPSQMQMDNGFLTDSIFCNLGNPDSNFIVPTNFNNQCIKDPPPTCLRKKTFVRDYKMPASPLGYILVYQRCCRNAAILNIVNPSMIGATYYCLIPTQNVAPQNSSAVFKNYPPQIICLNEPLFYDHSATDPDNDSLSYEFCDTYAGGQQGDPKPFPGPPPFENAKYVSPFSYENPMGGYPQVQINPVTGLITGTPNLLGRFVVSVCCHEWRHGIMINTVKREFQFVVTSCSKKVIADIPLLSTQPNTYEVDCANYTVHFINTSSGGFSYFWSFGERGATDTAFQPTYTYHDTGVYIVNLQVNKGSTCPDSISRFVKIYPSFKAAFNVSGTQCPGATLSFFDATSATYQPINFWEYRFGDGDTSYQQNTTHIYGKGGEYNVSLISQNIKGCSDTSLQQVVIDKIRPVAGNDTVIIQNEKIYFDAFGGVQYTWSTEGNNYLSNDSIYNPIGTFPDTGRFVYNLHVVSPMGCTGDTSVQVWVIPHSEFFVPTAFTPNGDGKNDLFRAFLVGYKAINYLKVFDRWGEMVFETKNIEQGWDGSYMGKKAEIGTYYWEISVVNKFGASEKKHGDVTLIR